ncbi:MAG: Clp protease N-terminal domain-containing protein, partial [Gemmatimonadales bacterium]
MGVNLRGLIQKLNNQTRNAVEAAAGLCLGRTHYDVEIEHFLMKLLDGTDHDIALILRQCGVDRSRLASDLTKSLDKLKTGNARTPTLSPTFTKMLTQAWVIGSVEYGASRVRTGHTLVALTTDEELVRLMRDVSHEFAKINGESLRKDFPAIVADSIEEATSDARDTGGAGEAGGAPRPGGGKTPNLDQFTVDLTERARKGRIDP